MKPPSYRAAASTGCPLATHAALSILSRGGNAVDAAIAATAVLFVTMPMSCGPGGDLVCLVYDREAGRVLGLTALGHAPSGATIARFHGLGHSRIPVTGLLSSTTPVGLQALQQLNRRFSALSLERLFSDAISLAHDGFEISNQFNRWTTNNISVVTLSDELAALYAPQGVAREPGSRLRQVNLGRTLELFAANPSEYRPTEPMVRGLLELSRTLGEYFTETDMSPKYDETVLQRAIGGGNLHTSPLPTQGILLLNNFTALLEALPADMSETEAHRIHLACEIYNQTYHKRRRFAGDPEFVNSSNNLLMRSSVEDILRHINPHVRTPCLYNGFYSGGDTTHLVVGDENGNGASIITSLSLGFGSGLPIPGTGVILNNRLGRSAVLDESDPNGLAPGKRPVNTIHNYALTDEAGLVAIGGTPGGDGQVQWNAQVLEAVVRRGMDAERAIRLPRFTYYPGGDLAEADMPESIHVENVERESVVRLRARGYDVRRKSRVQGALRMLRRVSAGWNVLDDQHEDGLSTGF